MRRGSTTTTRPPRSTISWSWSRTRGAVSTEPCETIGLAPIMNRKLRALEVRDRDDERLPYSSALAAKRLFTSCEPAV